jgi:hypothetical protein
MTISSSRKHEDHEGHEAVLVRDPDKKGKGFFLTFVILRAFVMKTREVRP